MHTTDTETRVSSPLESPQYLHRIYHEPHGETHTLSVREHVGAVWGPERLLVLEPAENVERVDL